VPADGARGYALAAVAVAVLLALGRQRRFPAPLIVIGLGFAYALATSSGDLWGQRWIGLRLPALVVPDREQVIQGALLLALPQIPLSLGNSVIATSQTTRDLFPGREVPVRKIGITYGLMNLIGPWFGAMPACHGCGGLAGFHGFGARTGGAPVIYGSIYLALGLLFAPAFSTVVHVFPMPVMGVVLLFEAVALMALVRDVAGDGQALWLSLAVAAAVLGLPYGYAVGLVAGTLMGFCVERGWARLPARAVESLRADGDAEPLLDEPARDRRVAGAFDDGPAIVEDRHLVG